MGRPAPTTDIMALAGYDAAQLTWPPPRKERSESFLFLQWLVERVHVLVMTVPLAGVVVAARYGNLTLNSGSPQSPIDATALPPLITFAAFVMGTVMANVMQDYKESEKIPAEMLGYFQALVTFARTECRARDMDERPALLALQDMLLCVMAYVDGKAEFSGAMRCYEAAWQRYCSHLLRLLYSAHSSNGGHIELEGAQHCNTEIVKKWGRIHDISKNSIVLPGYMLMDLITGLLIAALVSVSYKDVSVTTGYWATGIFSALAIYLNVMVRQLDDPFAMPKGFWFKSFANGVEVETSLLETAELVCNVDMGSLLVVVVWLPHPTPRPAL